MYKLYTDKQEVFEAKLELEGANINNSFARLILENKDLNLVFDGKIKSDGSVIIPIKKLKNVLSEGATGNLKLEVIADDTYFSPWNDKFEVKASKKLTVEVTEQEDKETITEEVKPKVTLSSVGKVKLAEEYVTDYIQYISKKDIKSQNDFDLLTEHFVKKEEIDLDTEKEFYTILKTIL